MGECLKYTITSLLRWRYGIEVCNGMQRIGKGKLIAILKWLDYTLPPSFNANAAIVQQNNAKRMHDALGAAKTQVLRTLELCKALCIQTTAILQCLHRLKIKDAILVLPVLCLVHQVLK